MDKLEATLHLFPVFWIVRVHEVFSHSIFHTFLIDQPWSIPEHLGPPILHVKIEWCSNSRHWPFHDWSVWFRLYSRSLWYWRQSVDIVWRWSLNFTRMIVSKFLKALLSLAVSFISILRFLFSPIQNSQIPSQNKGENQIAAAYSKSTRISFSVCN